MTMTVHLLVLCGLLTMSQLAFAQPGGNEQENQAIASKSFFGMPTLRTELLARYEKDQKVREEFLVWANQKGMLDDAGNFQQPSPSVKLELLERTAYERKIDSANAQWLRSTVERVGWPKISDVGVDGAKAAFMLLQHCEDEGFQENCLTLMKQIPSADCYTRGVAYLTDRLLVKRGEKQRYGTQLAPSRGGFEPLPIQDPESVNLRRAELGMETLEHYIQQSATEMKRIASGNSTPINR